jgi:hypothetical protein
MRRHTMQACKFVGLMILLCAAMVSLAADGRWLKHVPEADRNRGNPFAGQPEAIAAGGRVFEDHCAKCRGEDATGRAKRPSLRSDRVQRATRRRKSSGYCETAMCRRVCPPGRRCQSRAAGRLPPTSRAWGLPRPPLLPPLLIPSRIRYYIGMCRTPRRLTFHINSWRSAWQTIC